MFFRSVANRLCGPPRGAAWDTSKAPREQLISIFRTPGKPALSRALGKPALSLGERVARDGAFSSRRGSGEGFLPFTSQLVSLEVRIGYSSSVTFP